MWPTSKGSPTQQGPPSITRCSPGGPRPHIHHQLAWVTLALTFWEGLRVSRALQRMHPHSKNKARTAQAEKPEEEHESSMPEALSAPPATTRPPSTDGCTLGGPQHHQPKHPSQAGSTGASTAGSDSRQLPP